MLKLSAVLLYEGLNISSTSDMLEIVEVILIMTKN